MGTREVIMDKSEWLARQKGFKGFSFAHLADEVGISKASIYHHFKSKSDLLLALLVRYAEDERIFLDEITEKHKLAKDKLNAFIEGCRWELHDGDVLALTVVFSVDPTGLSNPIQKELTKYYDHYIAWLKDVFETAQKDNTVSGVIDPEAEALALYSLADGAQFLAFTRQDTTVFDRAMQPFQSRFK